MNDMDTLTLYLIQFPFNKVTAQFTVLKGLTAKQYHDDGLKIFENLLNTFYKTHLT